MFGYLRQSTAGQSRTIGPFVDDTDFKTLENGLTIANTDIKLKKNGATAVNKNSGGATSDVNGMYGVTFDATDTSTAEEFQMSVSVAGALVVVAKFTVLEEAVYDLLFASGASGDVKLQAITHTGATIPTVTTVGTTTAVTNAITVGTINANVITATSINAAAFTQSKFGSNFITSSSIATGAITADGIAANAIGASEFSQAAADKAWSTTTRALTDKAGFTISGAITTLDGLQNISTTDILASGDIDGFSIENSHKLLLTALAGKLAGAGTNTNTLRAADDSKARITATVDAVGNRTAITLDVTG